MGKSCTQEVVSKRSRRPAESGTHEGFIESVDDDPGRRSLDLDEGVANPVGLNGDVDVAVGEGLGRLGRLLRLGVKANTTQELTARASDPVEEESDRSGDGSVDSVLDRSELRAGRGQ